MLELYTDGAVSCNGQVSAIGSWAFVIVKDDKIIQQDSKKIKGITNQQAELLAAIEGIKAVQSLQRISPLYLQEKITVYSDSAYLINCYKEKWYEKWELNGWISSTKVSVLNRHLWEQLLPSFKSSRITFKKVKGHGTDKYNVYVDKLAVATRLKGE